MMRSIFVVLALAFLAGTASAQVPSRVPAKAAPAPSPAAAPSENTFSSLENRFQLTFPAGWRFVDDAVQTDLRDRGFDLSLKAPENIDKVGQIQVERYLERVSVLLTAVKLSAAEKDSPIIRIATEDLTPVPQVRDAVDYFDLMRSQFAVMKLPAGFTYSETQAEQLGKKQFGFIDTANGSSKKRIYATVRGRKAIVFTLTYIDADDLKTFRDILAAGNFAYK
ncbi:MAG: hypothetical protein QUS14_04045 [Pyrinomonadaceae bacterium]|nr:hypothetical protein [Pyrinomonadaceae bacterium]